MYYKCSPHKKYNRDSPRTDLQMKKELITYIPLKKIYNPNVPLTELQIEKEWMTSISLPHQKYNRD